MTTQEDEARADADVSTLEMISGGNGGTDMP